MLGIEVSMGTLLDTLPSGADKLLCTPIANGRRDLCFTLEAAVGIEL